MEQILTNKIMETPTSTQDDEDKIIFSDLMKKDLRTTSYWSTFISIFTLSIMSFAFFGYTYLLYSVYSISRTPMSEIISKMPWQGYAGILFFLACFIILILASISLLLFSFEIKKSADYENSAALELSVDLLLKFFRYNGIFIIGVFLTAFLFYLYIESFKF